MKRWLIVTVFLLLLCSACIASPDQDLIAQFNNISHPKLEKTRIIVGGDRDYPPYSYLDSDGQPQGVDVEIMNAIAVLLGLQIDYNLTSWDEALRNLLDGKVDVVVGMADIEELTRIYDLTISTHSDSYAIFTRSGVSYSKLSDMKGMWIAVLAGDSAYFRFIQPLGLDADSILMESFPDAFQSLEKGEVDFVLAPYTIGHDIIAHSNYQNIRTVGPAILPSQYCMSVQKGNSELLAALNSSIDTLKGNGTIDSILKKANIRLREEKPLWAIIKNVGIVLGPAVIMILVLIFWSYSLQKLVRQRTHALARSEERYKTLVGNIPGIVYRCANDADWTMEYISRGIEDITGYPAEDFIGNKVRSYASVIYEADRELVNTMVQEGVHKRKPFSKEYRLVHKDGTLNWVHERGMGIFDNKGNLLYLDGLILNINERKRLEEELRVFATTDPITGVFNRHFGLSFLQKQIDLSRRTGDPLSVCYIDINNLKKVNDGFGHQEGDKLINDLIKILKECLREMDVVCRIGGDEFLLIFPNTDTEGARKVWKRIDLRMETENRIGKRPYLMSVSHGIAEYTSKQAMTLESLVSLADSRMYEDKRIQKTANDVNGFGI